MNGALVRACYYAAEHHEKLCENNPEGHQAISSCRCYAAQDYRALRSMVLLDTTAEERQAERAPLQTKVV